MPSVQRGFTLVETLVGSVLIALIGVVLYSVFSGIQAQIRTSSGSSRVQQFSNLLHSSIAQTVSSTAYSVSAIEYDSAYYNRTNSSGTVINLDAITERRNSPNALFIMGQDSTRWVGWAIQDHWLCEKSGSSPSDTSGTWPAMKIGTDSLWIANTMAFIMLEGRKSVRFDPGYVRLSSAISDSVFFPGLTIRNAAISP